MIFDNGEIDDAAIEKAKASFHTQHLQIYGFNNPGGEIESVNLRLVGLGVLEKKPKSKAKILSSEIPVAERSQKALFKGLSYEAKIYQREQLLPGQSFMGPAIVEELTSTTVVPPYWKVTIDAYNSMVITRENEGGAKNGL